MKKILFAFVGMMIVAGLVLPVFVPVVGAQEPQNTTGIKNPLKVDSIQAFIGEVLRFFIDILIVAGVMYIIWTGFMFVKAQGNPKELEVAKKAFLNALIGMAIILGAWALTKVITNTINKITNNNEMTFRQQ